MNNNQRKNQIEIKKFRNELASLSDDIGTIDKKVLDRAVNEGMAVAKNLTPTDTGFLKKSWFSAPAVKAKDGVANKTLVNSANYASFVNYGHRIVTVNGINKGYKKGLFMLEKAVSHTEKALAREFKKELERIKKEHGV